MKRTWEEEKTCSKASSLTLIGITKGPKNKDKEKEIEIVEEKGDDRGNEQAHLESPVQERQERQKSLSPIWNLSPHVRELMAIEQQCRNDGDVESYEARDAGKGQTTKNPTVIER